MSLKTTIFVGAGGVGKTSLVVSYALSQAQKGKKIGILGIDPSVRICQTLHVDPSDDFVKVPFLKGISGELFISVLNVQNTFKRWFLKEGLSLQKYEILIKNPIYQMLNERFATAIDTFALARMIEIWEEYSDLDELIIDTAPGLHALDLIRKRETLDELFTSRMLSWLRFFKKSNEKEGFFQRGFSLSGKTIMGGLILLCGKDFISMLSEFFESTELVLMSFMKRIQEAGELLDQGRISFVLVSAPRQDAFDTLLRIKEEIISRKYYPKAFVMNQSFLDFQEENLPLNYFLSYYKNKEMKMKNFSPFPFCCVPFSFFDSLDDFLRSGDILSQSFGDL